MTNIFQFIFGQIFVWRGKCPPISVKLICINGNDNILPEKTCVPYIVPVITRHSSTHRVVVCLFYSIVWDHNHHGRKPTHVEHCSEKVIFFLVASAKNHHFYIESILVVFRGFRKDSSQSRQKFRPKRLVSRGQQHTHTLFRWMCLCLN